MDSSDSTGILHEFPPFFRIYKNGRVERITADAETVPPSDDPHTGVQSKDTVVSHKNSLSVRLFIPKIKDPSQKLPLLIYIHGGAFCIESPFSSTYHSYVANLVHQANVIAVSVQYRRAPEHPLPVAYDDSWAAIQWVASHVNGNGVESWLNKHADFERTFLVGDSAGANIAHNMTVRAGVNGLIGVKIVGMVLAHPFFGGKEPEFSSPVLEFMFPGVNIYDDPRINPAGAGGVELASLQCSRVLILVAGKDGLRERGCNYYEALKQSGWGGAVEIVETEGEGHVFHLLNPNCDKAGVMMKQVYKDGRVDRYWNTDFVEAGVDTETGVQSKDVVISPETNVRARIFLPKINGPAKKLPLLVHYHGGGFCIGSPFAPAFKTFLSALATQANVIAVSIDYRLAPEHKLPTAYDDSLAGLQWIATHSDGKGPEPWINEHADLGRVILAGESAGATLAHYVAVQAGAAGMCGVAIKRLLIVHPYFGAREPDKFYQYMCPTSSGKDDDPKLNPAADPDLMKLKCDAVLVCVAEKDKLKGRGVTYYEAMKKCGWGGAVDFYETKGEDHCFHFFNPRSENIGPLLKKMVDFIQLD